MLEWEVTCGKPLEREQFLGKGTHGEVLKYSWYIQHARGQTTSVSLAMPTWHQSIKFWLDVMISSCFPFRGVAITIWGWRLLFMLVVQFTEWSVCKTSFPSMTMIHFWPQLQIWMKSTGLMHSSSAVPLHMLETNFKLPLDGSILIFIPLLLFNTDQDHWTHLRLASNSLSLKTWKA